MKDDEVLETQVIKFPHVSMKLVKLKDDPLCLRVSAGGTEKEGYYNTYRGDPKKIKVLLERCLEAINMKIMKDKSDKKDQNIN